MNQQVHVPDEGPGRVAEPPLPTSSMRRARHRRVALESGSQGYHWVTIQEGQHRFLKPLFDSLGVIRLRVWIDAGLPHKTLTRQQCSGLVTALAIVEGRTVAVAWSDFRVDGASYGHGVSRRFAAFLRHVRQSSTAEVPLIYFVNSAGVSLMDGRTVFSDAFALWPELLRYAENHLLLTCASGKCLGLAPLLFGLGHYRIAVAEGTQINLTGPGVIRMFFGETLDFTEHAAAERFVAKNDLVHELVPSLDAACERFRDILSMSSAPLGWCGDDLGPDTASLLEVFLDSPPREVIPGWCPRVRLFLGARNGRRLGIFINPMERSNNMITVRTLDKYAAGLDLMRALGLPIVSFLDSPGIDPRFNQSDANNIRKMLWVGEKIIHYPHGCMGVVTRRCFGGSSTLGFPKVFGGSRTIALRGSNIGPMHESIIARLLGCSPRLLEQWQTVFARQGPGLEDLIAAGIIDAVVGPHEIPREIDSFMEQLHLYESRGNTIPFPQRSGSGVPPSEVLRDEPITWGQVI